MKKLFALVCVLALTLALCACGKSEATKAVEAQIGELTDVTYEDRDRVAAVRLSYSNLSSEEKEDVENLAILVQAEQKIAEEEQKLIDSIAADYDPYEAIPLLRQIENNAYAQSQISALGVKLLQNYVLENGYQSDYRGRPDAEDDYKAVSVDSYPDTFYFVTNPERASVTFVYRDESAVNRLLKSQYSVDRRDHALTIFSDGGSYSKTEWIDEGWRYAGYVSWYVSFNSHSDLDNLSPDIESGDVLFWPYSDSEEDLEKYSKMNVEDYIKQMDQCVSALNIPVTGWELLGFF